MNTEREVPGEAWTSTSEGTVLIEVTEGDTVLGEPIVHPQSLLRRMRWRVGTLGVPLPEGYVAPPGIDLPALLRQVPWPPSADQHPAGEEQ